MLARLDARASAEVWRVNAGDLGEIRDVQLDPERRHALIAGGRAWRLFRLEDGFAASALLAPPPALGEPAESKPVESMECQLEGALGPRGELVASCRGQRFAWRPREYEGRIEPRLAQLTCAVDVSESALETIRRCYVAR